MNSARVFLVLALIAIYSPNRLNGAGPQKLDVPLRPQQMSNWCWAASSQMAMEFILPLRADSFQQCIQARQNPRVIFASDQNCCNGSTSICDETNWPILGTFGFQSDIPTDVAASWDTIKANIQAKRPVVFAVKWDGGGGGHMLCIYGYEEKVGGENVLYVYDPKPIPNPDSTNPDLKRGGDRLQLRYEEYRDGSQMPHRFGKADWPNMKHWRTYCGIQESAPGATPSAVKYERASDELAVKGFQAIRPRLAEVLGPGGDIADISLSKGTTFHMIPFKTLTSQDAPGGDALLTIGRGSAKTRVFSMKSKERGTIVGSVKMMWKDEGPIEQAVSFDIGKSWAFESQVDDAIGRYVREYGEPKEGFSGFMFHGINKSFLYVKRDGKEQLVPVERDPTLGFIPGVPVRMDVVTKQMGELARRKQSQSDAP